VVVFLGIFYEHFKSIKAIACTHAELFGVDSYFIFQNDFERVYVELLVINNQYFIY